ncbi:MAG TPA: TetR/AcrR family transcriptional regulator [Gammaproteobacteria bacterium]|nr:TetR/AcrR family transcriptional regulator [Gammaproteobacteria bacterium]
MSTKTADNPPGKKIKQKRGQRTYNALVATAFELLENEEYDTLTVDALARAAGYSVGAFYARFRSKDEFFDALMAEYAAQRRSIRAQIFATVEDDKLVDTLIRELVTYYWQRSRFWRAALFRSVRDPEFWAPVRNLSHEFSDLMIEHMSARAGRKLDTTETTNVQFAIQVALGTINNSIINRPGPVFLGQARFIDNLARTFRLVSDYDRIVAISD